MKIVVSNPGLGNHVRNTVRAYFDNGLLEKFYSTLVFPNNSIVNGLSKKYSSIKSKQFLDIPNNKIHKLIFPEVSRLFSSKFLNSKITDQIWEWSELKFDYWVSKQLNSSVDVFHGYEHASLYSLQKCVQENIFSVYEQPSAHHLFFTNNIVKILFDKEPEFKASLAELYDSELAILRNKRRDEELRIADLILCNSTYVKSTLVNAGISESKILVHPLGFPNVMTSEIESKISLTFMISGNLSYLKGTHHVLRVWKNNPEIFNNHKLICIGSDTLSPEEWGDLPKNIEKYNRLSSDEYLKKLSDVDVYILNTYSDGFGMVMSEAMAYGKAVIGTENSAAPDIIDNNVTGKIIPVGNEEALKEAMIWMIQNPVEVKQMRLSAMNYANEHSWSRYRTELSKLIQDKFNDYINK